MTIENKELFRLWQRIDKNRGSSGVYFAKAEGGIAAYAADGAACFRKLFKAEQAENFAPRFLKEPAKAGFTDTAALEKPELKKAIPVFEALFEKEPLCFFEADAKELKQAAKAVSAATIGDKKRAVVLSMRGGRLDIAARSETEKEDYGIWSMEGRGSGSGALRLDKKPLDGALKGAFKAGAKIEISFVKSGGEGSLAAARIKGGEAEALIMPRALDAAEAERFKEVLGYAFLEPGKEKEAEIRSLAKKIKSLQKSYYKGKPEIQDAAFDLLMSSLKSLAPDHPLLKGVGKDRAKGFPKAKHVTAIGSLNGTTSEAEFRAWAASANAASYAVQHKLDGAAIELQYENGKLAKAVTRGDGYAGSDITANALKMRGVPPQISEDFTGAARGEVVMAQSAWKAEPQGYSSSRSAACGIMQRKDGRGCGCLDVVCFGVLDSRRAGFFKSEVQKTEWLKARGFKAAETRVFSSAEGIAAWRSETASMRGSAEYAIDGLVVKDLAADEADLRRLRPERQIAFKFEAAAPACEAEALAACAAKEAAEVERRRKNADAAAKAAERRITPAARRYETLMWKAKVAAFTKACCRRYN